MKIPVAVCEATYAKMSLADSTGLWVIGPPREGSLNRAKVLISGIFKHALIVGRDPRIADIHEILRPTRHKTHTGCILSSRCFPTVFLTKVLGQKQYVIFNDK